MTIEKKKGENDCLLPVPVSELKWMGLAGIPKLPSPHIPVQVLQPKAPIKKKKKEEKDKSEKKDFT